MSLLFYLGQVYFYKRVLGPYEGDPNYFLKEQLFWIGKIYDPTCWIDHGKVEDQLRSYLEEKLAEGRPMDREAQEAFKYRFHVDLPAVAAERKAALEAEEQARRSKEKHMKVQIILGDQVMYSSEGIRQGGTLPKQETKDAQGEET